MRKKLQDLLKKLPGRRRDTWAVEPEELDHIDNLSPIGRVGKYDPDRYAPRHRRTR